MKITKVISLFILFVIYINGFAQVPPNINSGNPNFRVTPCQRLQILTTVINGGWLRVLE